MMFTRDIFACHDPLLPLLYLRLSSAFKCPSGLGFSLDGTKLYVANSCVEEPAWYVYDVNDEGSVSNRRLFLDAKPLRKVCSTTVPRKNIKESSDCVRWELDRRATTRSNQQCDLVNRVQKYLLHRRRDEL